MTKQAENIISEHLKKTMNDVRFQGIKAGAKGILGAVLIMCNEGKSVEEIKEFCEKSLSMNGMK